MPAESETRMTILEEVGPALSGALPHVAARVEERYPTARPALIRRCVEDAASWFGEARVRLYLPVLIERRAVEALRVAIASGHESRPGNDANRRAG